MSENRITNNGRYFISHFLRRGNTGISEVNPYNASTLENRKISNENLNVGYSNNGISKVTSDKIKIRCRVLSFAAELKELKNWQGEIIKHRTSFITLTLPSKQLHSDQIITKEILGKFLDKCRKVNILKNYVWKAEKQRNGNIHYHLLTDSYCNRTILYRYWLISLNSLGYVERYTDKFKNMDLQSYSMLKFNAEKSDYKIKNAYWKGQKNGWKLPPCYDSKNVTSNASIEKYLSKYMSKGNSDFNNRVLGRTWGCSSNINAGVELFKNDAKFNDFGFKICKFTLRAKCYISDFFQVVLYDISKFFVWFPDVRDMMFAKLRTLISPCRFYSTA